jgi:hypothetical protein
MLLFPDNYLSVRHDGVFLVITSDLAPEARRYMFYSERDAIREFRREFGLIGKHLHRI